MIAITAITFDNANVTVVAVAMLFADLCPPRASVDNTLLCTFNRPALEQLFDRLGFGEAREFARDAGIEAELADVE